MTSLNSGISDISTPSQQLLAERALRRGVFRSVVELEKAIQAYMAATYADPKPLRWTKKTAQHPALLPSHTGRKELE